MTTDIDKVLAETLEAIERNPGTLGSLLIRNLAEVLVATRRELAELRAIVGTVELPNARSFLRAVVHEHDPCPHAGSHECRYQLGVRRCVAAPPVPEPG